MDSISERIARIIDELGYNKNSFSKAIGLGNNVTIGRIINEKRDPSFEVLSKITQKFGAVVNTEWLLTGEGEMLQQRMSNAVTEPDAHYQVKDEQIRKTLANLEFLSDSIKVELQKLKNKIG